MFSDPFCEPVRPMYEPFGVSSNCVRTSISERREYPITPLSISSKEILGNKRRFEGKEFNRYPPRDCDITIYEFTRDKVNIDNHNQILSTRINVLETKKTNIDIRRIEGIWNGYNFMKPSDNFCKTLGETVYLPNDVSFKRINNIYDRTMDNLKILYIDRIPFLRWDVEGRYVYYE